MCSRSLLSIVLMGLISGGISQISGPKFDYAMIVPNKLMSGSEATLCMWVKSEVEANVRVTMEYEIELAVITIVDISDTSEHYGCTSFTVPKVQSQKSYNFTFSASGNGVNKINRKSVVIDVPHSTCLAQKDKPLCKQGETIQIRFVCFDEELKQVVKNFIKVTLVDQYGNRVKQILNPTLDHGVLTTSFTTSKFSRLGNYSVELEDEKGNTDSNTYFKIQRFEQPRIKFNAQCPQKIGVSDKLAEMKGSATYTYGKPVQGTVAMKCCRSVPKYGKSSNCYSSMPDICHEYTRELDQDGNFYEALGLDLFKLQSTGYEKGISCNITMKEQGTGALNPISCYMPITNGLPVLRLDRAKMGRHYNKINALFSATLTDDKDNPLANRSITITIDGEYVKRVTTDENGRAESEIDTSSYSKENITIAATLTDEKDNPLASRSTTMATDGDVNRVTTDEIGPRAESEGIIQDDLCYNQVHNNNDKSYTYDEMTLSRYYSNSGSLVRLRPLSGVLACYQDYSIEVDYLFSEDGVGKGATTASIKYFIVSKNKIVAHGESIVDLSESYSGSTVIKFYTDSNFATGAEVMVFVPLANDVISDSATLKIGFCFKNKVTLAFTEAVVGPGTTVSLKVTGAPGSFCGLRAKDANFNFFRSHDEFTPDQVYNRLQSNVKGYEYGGIKYEEPEPACIDGNTIVSSRAVTDTHQHFQDLKVLIFTNLDTKRPKVCGEETDRSDPYYPVYDGPSAKSIDAIPNSFSDFFAFETTILDSDGVSVVDSLIPQAIANWESNAFCISANKGIGLTTEPARTKTFRPFFVEAFTPSYVTRGEVVHVPIEVASYMEKCAMVKVDIENSDNYILNRMNDTNEKCICGERVIWNAAITFIKKGLIDVSIRAATTMISDTCNGPNDDHEPSQSHKIAKRFTVKLEGIKRTAFSSHLVPLSGLPVEVPIRVVEPDNMVPDSFELFANVMGDIVALPLENFDNLLSTPIFSCYQIQSSLESIIFLAKYLEATGDLDEERLKKMRSSLELGYMDLLSCRDYDSGAFSLYMDSNIYNSWLTLSILRTFYYMKDYIFLDDKIIPQGLKYLSQKQDLQSGCLVPDGPPLKYQENYNIGVQFTAFTAPILVELSANYSNAKQLLKGVKMCLSNVDFEKQDTMTQSYMLNAASSSGQTDQLQSHYNTMAKKAVTTEDTLSWSNDNSAQLQSNEYFPQTGYSDGYLTAMIYSGMQTGFKESFLADLDNVVATSENLLSGRRKRRGTVYSVQSQFIQELNKSMPKMKKWLSGQLNHRGGSYSAQDTNMLIEALTRFDPPVNTKDTNAKVSMRYNGGEVFGVPVTKQNRFLVHRQKLSQGFGNYTFVADGNGRPFLQVTASFNTKIVPGQDSAFAVVALASAYECIDGVGKLINIEISIRYNGKRKQSSNCVVKVEILTGYIVDFPYKLPYLSPPRMEDNTALFFFDTVNSTGITFTVPIYFQNLVRNLQPASVIVQDTETAEMGAAEYYYPCF